MDDPEAMLMGYETERNGKDEAKTVYAPTKWPNAFHMSKYGPHIQFQRRLKYCHARASCGTRNAPGPVWDTQDWMTDGYNCVCQGESPADLGVMRNNRCFKGKCIIGQNAPSEFADESRPRYADSDENLDAKGLCVFYQILDNEIDRSFCDRGGDDDSVHQQEFLEPPAKLYRYEKEARDQLTMGRKGRAAMDATGQTRKPFDFSKAMNLQQRLDLSVYLSNLEAEKVSTTPRDPGSVDDELSPPMAPDPAEDLV
jgi:hypothetical protein